MRKKTFDEIEQEVNEQTNGTIKIRSKYYNGNRTMMTFECICGKLFDRTYVNFQKGKKLCPDCIYKLVGDKNKKDFNQIIKAIESTGCQYISGEYENVFSKLLIRCRCGNIFQQSWERFNRGGDHCIECTKKLISESCKKYTPEMAKEIFSSYGYQMIGEYTAAQNKTLCLCKRGHECYITLSMLPFHSSSCYQCYLIDNRGENHSNYKGGVTMISGSIRNRLVHWIDDIKNLYENRCPISGDTDNLVVHHLISLNSIFNKIIDKYNISIKQHDMIKSFESDNLFNKILDDIIAEHNKNIGILISKEIHLKFHSEYGFGDNTPEQFNEFIQNHYNTNLLAIQKVV